MDELIKNIETLGFTNYESKVLRVLFSGHLLSASEIAKDAGIPRPSAHDILKLFVKRGICNEIHTSTSAKYEIIDPKVVEDKFEKEFRDLHKAKMSKLKESFAVLHPLFKTKEKERQKVDVQLIKGFNRHRQAKFIDLWKSSSKELLLMNRIEGYADTTVDDMSKKYIKKGGVIKTLYDTEMKFKLKQKDSWADVDAKEFAKMCEGFEKFGIQVRLSGSIRQNMAIFDRHVVFISLVDPTISKYNRTDVIIKNESYAVSMAEYFETCWKNALTIKEFKARNK